MYECVAFDIRQKAKMSLLCLAREVIFRYLCGYQDMYIRMYVLKNLNRPTYRQTYVRACILCVLKVRAWIHITNHIRYEYLHAFLYYYDHKCMHVNALMSVCMYIRVCMCIYTHVSRLIFAYMCMFVSALASQLRISN